MQFGSWLRLLRRNRFRVHPTRWGLAMTITSLTVFNSLMGRFSRWRYRDRVEATELVETPIFIVGHWRSGTTYLHELLSLDARFASPTTYECFAANHFLSTAFWLPRLVWFLMPARRPMDNVHAGWDSPQEDEFALCSLGVPSPYLRMAFPNEPDQYLEYLDLQTLPAPALRDWQDALWHFLRCLTFRHQKRLILKSPTHTARIRLLAQMFPQARFLHIVRNPLSVYPSTINLWQVLDEAQGLQRPHHRQLKSYVLAAFERMYTAFETQRAELRPDQIFDLRYEDLVDDPVKALQQAYAHLRLGDFENIRPALESIAQTKRRYQTNQYDLPEELANEILQRWSVYARRYGYAKDE
jgi:omega-hydroxy-beta-dihydromenaquinone-9 sulfotransferase